VSRNGLTLFNIPTVTFLEEGGGKLRCWESTSVKIVNLIVEFFKSIANMVCLSRTSNQSGFGASAWNRDHKIETSKIGPQNRNFKMETSKKKIQELKIEIKLEIYSSAMQRNFRTWLQIQRLSKN